MLLAPWCPRLLSPHIVPGRHTYCPPAPMSHETATFLPAQPFSPVATTLGMNVTIYGRGTRQHLPWTCPPLEMVPLAKQTGQSSRGPGSFHCFASSGCSDKATGWSRIQRLRPERRVNPLTLEGRLSKGLGHRDKAGRNDNISGYYTFGIYCRSIMESPSAGSSP